MRNNSYQSMSSCKNWRPRSTRFWMALSTMRDKWHRTIRRTLRCRQPMKNNTCSWVRRSCMRRGNDGNDKSNTRKLPHMNNNISLLFQLLFNCHQQHLHFTNIKTWIVPHFLRHVSWFAGCWFRMEQRQKRLFKLIKSNNTTQLEKGGDFDDLVNTPHHRSFQYPVHLAAELGHLDVLKWLFKSGANFNVTDRDGKHCLHYAAHQLHYDCCAFIINGKCNWSRWCQ